MQTDAIPREDYHLFHYAMYSFLWGLIPAYISILLGLCTNMLKESIVMIIPVIILRKFSGGYHLTSQKKCIILSTAVLSIALFFVRITILLICKTLLTVTVTIATISICCNSPIDSEARKLNYHQKIVYRKIARIIAIGVYSIYIMLILRGQLMTYSALGIGIIVPALLQIPCMRKE